MIKAIFLDIDNTLLDFDAYVRHALKTGFEKYGLGEFNDRVYDIFHTVNTQIWHELEQGLLTYEELLKCRWNRIFSALHIDFDGMEFEHYFKSYLFDSAIPVEGAMDLLQYLQKGYLLCAASNGPHAQQVNRLKISGMLPFFAHVFISGQIGHSKPSKEFFDHCIRQINLDREEKILPEEILMIGDSMTSDMAGAVNNGLKTCYFDKNHQGKAGSLPLDYVFSSLAEIKNIL